MELHQLMEGGEVITSTETKPTYQIAHGSAAVQAARIIAGVARERDGKSVACANCGGHGIRTAWSFGVKEPDECPDCGGSGRNWRYTSGKVARYYGGPFV